MLAYNFSQLVSLSDVQTGKAPPVKLIQITTATDLAFTPGEFPPQLSFSHKLPIC